MKTRIAIIGAGLAGLTLARELSIVADVVVFEKARGVGGRMSTRYAEPFYFDHGAQFFTARTETFKGFIEPFIASGDIAEWKGKIITFEAGKEPDKSMWFEPHYVAVPNMNSLCKKLSQNITLLLNTEIAPLEARREDGWHLADKNNTALGSFDWVISTAPPAQTARLFGTYLESDASLHKAKLLGCYTLMIGFKRPWDKQWIAATIRDNPLQWLAVNSSKPGRDTNVTCLVAHSRHDWAEEHMDDDMETAQAFLVKELEEVTGLDLGQCDYLSTHRWCYANLAERQPLPPYIDDQLKLASAGDWCAASRIEDVWLAAQSLAGSTRSLLAVG
jgi:predicted NAD/FAD-dependent oxidoreductase